MPDVLEVRVERELVEHLAREVREKTDNPLAAIAVLATTIRLIRDAYMESLPDERLSALIRDMVQADLIPGEKASLPSAERH